MSQVYINSTNNDRLIVDNKTYYGSSSGHGTGTPGEFHVRSNGNGKYVCWVGSDGTRYCAKGVSIGATSEPEGSIWVPFADIDELRFSLGEGSAYSIDRLQIKNSIQNTSLLVYSDSSRTIGLTTVSYNATATLDPYRSTLYFRSQGLGDNPVSYDFSLSQAKAGHLYNITGTYYPGADAVFECQCNDTGATAAFTDPDDAVPERTSCPELSSGECFTSAENDICDYVFIQNYEQGGVLYWEYEVHRCETVEVSPDYDGNFAVNPTANLQP